MTLSQPQRDLIQSLRQSLEKHNIVFSDDGEIDPALKDSFLRTLEVERRQNLTARQFNAYLMNSRPVIITHYKPCTMKPWNLDVIEKMAGDNVVGIEVSKSNRFYSNEGLRKVNMTVRQFLHTFRDKDRPYDMYLAEESMDQVPKLRDDVLEPEFSENLNLDRLQLWVGAGGQVAPMHHDQWDNVLCQIEGTRVIHLFDPLQVDRLYPKTGANRYFSQLDPSDPKAAEKYPRFDKAKRLTVTLKAGEILFIPAMWWHQVHHAESVNIAINFWYDSHILSQLLYHNLLPPYDWDVDGGKLV